MAAQRNNTQSYSFIIIIIGIALAVLCLRGCFLSEKKAVLPRQKPALEKPVVKPAKKQAKRPVIKKPGEPLGRIAVVIDDW